MILEFEVENLIKRGNIGSALKLIASELDKLPRCKIEALLKNVELVSDLSDAEDSLAQAHHRLDTAWENLNTLERKMEELLK